MAIGEDEAMATVERHPQEIAQILEQFKKLMALGEDGFLIVQIDDFYVQFYVSTATRLDMDAQGIVKLLGFGFAPPEEGFNFTMSYTLSGEADFSYLAVLALAALFDVYHAPEHEPLSFELNSAA